MKETSFYKQDINLCLKWSILEHLQKTKKEYKNLKNPGDSRCIYQNKLDKPCFQHDMTYGDFKDLTRITATDNILRGKVFYIAKNAKNGGYQIGSTLMVCKFFDKKKFIDIYSKYA